MVDEIAAAADISHGTCHKIPCDVLKMSHVTQHRAPHILMQNRHDDCISICGNLIDNAIPTLADLHSSQWQLF
jgi:hypothetical protein